MQGLNRIFTRAFHTVETLSPCRIPRTGPAILICNHTSGLDPHLIQSACPRLITWMMAREYYDVPILRPLLDRVGVIPVTRGGRDLGATRSALRALERGQVLGIFPEGGIEETDALDPFQPGVAMMALKTGAAVYPAYLDGTQRRKEMLQAFLHPQRAVIAYADRLDLNDLPAERDKLDGATERMRNAIESLRQFVHKTRGVMGLREKDLLHEKND